MSTVTIASLYYIPLAATRPLYRGNFNIPAVPKGGKPELYTIKDHDQWEPQPFVLGTGPGGRQRMLRIIVDAMEIANCLVREWAESVPGCTQQCRPGVWVVRDRVYTYNADGSPQKDADGKPMFRDATDEEKRVMWEEDLAANLEAQANWGDRCIQAGNVMAEDPKKIPFIPDHYKAAARHFGLTPKWLNRSTDSNVRSCQWCTEQIPSAAIVCPKCSKVVDFEKFAQMEAQQQAAVAKAVKGVIQPPMKDNRPAA